MADWDPRSYLAEAAAAHLQSVDVNATATTVINYYDAIASHLEAADRHRDVASAIEEQRSLAPGVEESQTRIVRGVAFNVPFCVVLSSTVPRGDVCDALLRTFRRAWSIFAAKHHTASTVVFFHDNGSGDAEVTEVGECGPSDCQRFCAADVNQNVAVEKPLIDLLSLCRATNAFFPNFDPTCAAPLAEWRERLTDTTPRKPDPAVVDPLWQGVGIGTVLDWNSDECVLVKLTSSSTELDMSSVAKGWTVDRIFDELTALSRSRRPSPDLDDDHRWCDLLIEWGGDIRCSGVHPGTRALWVVGIPQPPKLPHLYSAWHAGEALPRPQLRHAVTMDPLGSAIAASGDYAQLFKYGYTHAMDIRRREPVQAQAQDICGCVCIAPTCAEADILASAVWLERSVTGALSRIRDLRRSRDSSAGPASLDFTSLAPRLLRVYLNERNNDTFIHDEDDGEDVGAGDEARLILHDKEAVRQCALHAFSSEHASLPAVSHDGSAKPVDVEAVQARIATLADLRAIATMRCTSMAVAVAPAAFDCRVVRDPGAEGGASASFGTRFMPVTRCNAVVLSSVILFGGGADGPQRALLNVIRGSGLFNHVREPGRRIGIHLLRNRHVAAAAQMLANHGAWLAAVTPVIGTCDASALPPSGHVADDGRVPVFVGDLLDCAAIAEVEHVFLVGDHLAVVAAIRPLDHVVSAAAAQEPFLLRLAGRFVSLPRAMVGCGVPSVTGVMYGSHAVYGKVGFPVRGITVCSESHAVALSCYAVQSSVTACITETGAVDRDTVSIAWLGNGVDAFVDGRETCHDSKGDSDDAETTYFGYLPFPSFRPAPGMVASIRGRVVWTAMINEAGGPGYVCFVVEVKLAQGGATAAGASSIVEWTEWGGRLRDAAAHHDVVSDAEDMLPIPLLSYVSALGSPAPVHVSSCQSIE